MQAGEDIEQLATAAATKAIRLGHPSYVWRRGQDRRLAFIRQYVELRAKRILDIGCGLGMYVSQFRQFSDDVYGVDIDPDKIARASEWLPNLRVSPAEELPFEDDSFDLILLNEVIEHVDDDRRTIAEAYRVLAPGGHIVVYAPNRLYPFETHGFFFARQIPRAVQSAGAGQLGAELRARLLRAARAHLHPGRGAQAVRWARTSSSSCSRISSRAATTGPSAA